MKDDGGMKDIRPKEKATLRKSAVSIYMFASVFLLIYFQFECFRSSNWLTKSQKQHTVRVLPTHRLPFELVGYKDLPWFIRMDEPCRTNIVSEGVIVTFVGAFHEQDKENKVIFIVLDHFHNETDRFLLKRTLITNTSAGLMCHFHLHDSQESSDPVRLLTKLSVFKVTDSSPYKPSHAWACDLPETQRGGGRDYSGVSIVITNAGAAHRESGSCYFRLEPPGSHQQLSRSEVVSCNKNMFGFARNPKMVPQLARYLKHYRRIGVSHFVMYVDEGENVAPAVEAIRESLQNGTYNDITLVCIPGSVRFVSDMIRDTPSAVQSITTNDCLWRSRQNGVPWTMVNFDWDEFLVGTSDLPSFLANYSRGAAHIGHSNAMNPTDGIPPLLLPGTVLNISNMTAPDFGKCIFRTKDVYLAWVHAPASINNIKPLYYYSNGDDVSKLKLIHFSVGKDTKEYMEENNLGWIEYTVPE